MSRKLRILWVGESSYLHTGYAVYAREVLSRLYATGKYKIAELGCYGVAHDARAAHIPWRFYGNLPLSEEEGKHYGSSPTNQFGEWRFNETVFDFRPDVVWDIRDWWMFEFQERSPLRPYYRWAIMPTVDSAPQQEGWISTYKSADAVFTYSEFGTDTLRSEGFGSIKLNGEAPPGANLNDLHPPENKVALRQAYGIPKECIIVGTVMRNQRRKLFPDLFQAFRAFCDKYPEQSKDMFLYCHTSYPDLGWDIPRLIREHNLSNKILFTYICSQCRNIIPRFFSDSKAYCHHCNSMTGMTPNTQNGVDPSKMKDIYGLMDVYVQYAICEGFGMPQVEAAACGVPVMAVNYSAMESVVKNLHGYPIKVKYLFREPETHAYRALPDNDDFIEKLHKFVTLPQSMRAKKSREALMGVRKHYTWDNTASVMEKYFDSIHPDERWASPPRIYQPVTEVPGPMSNDVLIAWGMLNVLKDPSMVNSFVALRMIRDLNYGVRVKGHGGPYYNEEALIGTQKAFQPYVENDALNELLTIRNMRNHWEARRCGLEPSEKPAFVMAAKPDVEDLE